jgi:hypothetical protein
LTSKQPIDISYIADALVQIDRYLHVATVSPDHGEQNKALIMAGRTGCAALNRLSADDQVWLRLRDLHKELQQWQRLQVPIVADLFKALGHGSTESADTLISTANDLIQEAAGFPTQRSEDPITQAQELVEELRLLTCALASSAQRKHWWMGVARAPLKILGGVLLGVVAAEADTGLREVAPRALHLVDELAERVGQALPSLSLGALVTGTRLARQDMTGISQPDSHADVDDREVRSVPIPGTGRWQDVKEGERERGHDSGQERDSRWDR